MKHICILTGLLVISACLFSQDINIQQLIKEGVALNDKGDYEGAVKKYDEVLAIDKNNYIANYEKSFTFFYMKKYDECIEISKTLLKLEPANPQNKSVYINYGSAEDNNGNAEVAIRIYDEGLKAYPGFYLLYFNKDLTLVKMGKQD